jgi:hypothetical protein
MTLVWFSIIAGLLALLCVLWTTKFRSTGTHHIDDAATQLRPVDVNAFRNLMDHGEREYLRTHLSSADFRSVHRERMLAAADYVWCAFRNAGILIRLAETSLSDPDPTVAATASNLQENATRLRFHAMQTLPKIYLSIIFPGLDGMSVDLAEGFDKLNRQAVVFVCVRAQ